MNAKCAEHNLFTKTKIKSDRMECFSDCTKLDGLLEKYPGLFECVVIDTETTGINHYDIVGGHARKNYVLQLTIISAHTGGVLYDGYFKPKIKSWPEAEKVNHITHNMVKDCPTIKAESEKIQKILDAARVVIGYNVYFDVGFLEFSGLNFLKTRHFIDVMEDYSVWNGDLHPYFHSFTWQKLIKAAKESGFDWAKLPPHNSAADCLATLHVAHWLQKQNKEKGWQIYYPPCSHYEGNYWCDSCDMPCRIRGRTRLCLVAPFGVDEQ